MQKIRQFSKIHAFGGRLLLVLDLEGSIDKNLLSWLMLSFRLSFRRPMLLQW